MAIFNIFSKRQKNLRGETPDVYVYDQIPQRLKVQIIHILSDTLGDEEDYANSRGGTRSGYKIIRDILCREYGTFSLLGRNAMTYHSEVSTFLLQEPDHEKILDAVEVSFRYIDRLTRDFDYLHRFDGSERADAAIAELNARFHEHGVGYQFTDGEIFRVDSQVLHSEVVKPALSLLRDPAYAGDKPNF